MNKRIALCIGNNSYEHLSSLSCAINDADVMGDVLMRLGYDSIVAHDLNRSDMEKLFLTFLGKYLSMMLVFSFMLDMGLKLILRIYLYQLTLNMIWL